MALAVALSLLLLAAPQALAQAPILVSVDSNGTQANALSQRASIDATGRYVAFESDASNLVAADTNVRRDVFLRDLLTTTTTRVSVDSAGTQANNSSQYPSISADGRSVAFQSGASKLVPGDTNGRRDIFVRDLVTGETTRVSVASGDLQANGNSHRTAISADGRYVAFESDATNLVPDDSNLLRDIFVHDRLTGETKRVTIGSSGEQANAKSEAFCITGNGRYVGFESYASNLVPGDTNGVRDIFVHDLSTGSTRRVSVTSSGAQANGGSENPSCAHDRFVAYESHAYNLVGGDTNRRRDVFVHDLVAGTTSLVSVAWDGGPANAASEYASISADGSVVAFRSNASNLAVGVPPGLGYVYGRHRPSGVTSLLATNSAGPNTDSSANFIPHLSGDGRSVAYQSDAPDLVVNDTNGVADVFLGAVD